MEKETSRQTADWIRYLEPDMPNKKPMLNPTILFLVALYHVGTLIADTETYVANVRRFGANPTIPNFIRVVAAEGVLIKDLNLPD